MRQPCEDVPEYSDVVTYWENDNNQSEYSEGIFYDYLLHDIVIIMQRSMRNFLIVFLVFEHPFDLALIILFD